MGRAEQLTVPVCAAVQNVDLKHMSLDVVVPLTSRELVTAVGAQLR